MKSGPPPRFEEFQAWLDARDLAVETMLIARELERRGNPHLARWLRRLGARPASLVAESFDRPPGRESRGLLAAARSAARAVGHAFTDSLRSESLDDLDWAIGLTRQLESELGLVLRGRR